MKKQWHRFLKTALKRHKSLFIFRVLKRHKIFNYFQIKQKKAKEKNTKRNQNIFPSSKSRVISFYGGFISFYCKNVCVFCISCHIKSSISKISRFVFFYIAKYFLNCCYKIKRNVTYNLRVF